MLKTISFDIKFSSTGKQFTRKLDFKPGLTVITGENEAGKSLILEMIEYAWFGVSALRAQSSEYDKLNVDMTWETRGETYTVSRHDSVQSLNKTLAVGAKAVNAEILKILGINLDVFRIACSSKQGELDKLTARMGATDRRKMVENVIGLNSLQAVEKLCKDEANAFKRLRDSLSQRVVEPEEPSEPEGYTLSDTLNRFFKDQLATEARRYELSRILRPTLPMEPVKGQFEDDVEQYELDRKTKETERAAVERTLRSIPPAKYSRQDTLYAEAYYAQQNRGPQPSITIDQANQWIADWEEIKRLAHSVECPRCQLKFIPGEGSVETVTEPPMNLKEIQSQLRYHENWEGFTFDDSLSTTPVMKLSEIPESLKALAQAELYDELQTKLDAIEVPASRADELNRKLAWDQAQVLYENDLNRYIENLTIWQKAQDELASLPEPDPDLEQKLNEARFFEEQKRRYDASMIEFEEKNRELEDLNKSVEAYNNGAEALKFVRSQVKQHLVPSLNKVASHLLWEMTNGQRKEIKVDEDFEVTVDGQPVRTLSGSGVSVVNLALRIALGQVLTQRILPVFLADEIDHDMGATRAEATHAALRKLTSTLKQVIVVSHKQIDGDNKIGV